MKRNKRKMSKESLSSYAGDKVTFTEFFTTQISVIRELLGKYKLRTTALIFISVITLSISIIELKFVEYVTNGVTGYFDGSVQFSHLVFISALFLSSIIVMQIFSNVGRKMQIRFSSDIGFDVSRRITKKLSEIPYEYYEYSTFQDKINHAREAGEAYSDAISGISQILNIAVTLIVYSFMLSRISALYICIIIFSIVVSIVISSKVTERRIINRYVNLSPNDRRNAYFGNIMGSRINHNNIQTTRNFPYFASAYEKFNTLTRKAAMKENFLMFFSEIVTSLLFAGTFFITIVVVGRGVADGKFEIGYFAMVIALLKNLFETVQVFSHYVVNKTGYIKALRAYYDVMELEVIPKNTEKCPDSTLINVKGLKYKYPQAKRNALNGIDISFKRGEKIAVVGYNGSGKSTLMSVILGLLTHYEGTVSNGAVVSAVLQDFGQYQMTVKESIELGCGGRELTDEKITDILKKVDLYDFIMSKSKGIYTNLGQLEKDGVEMSKGQYQRLALCRLLANENANVWILDEPTAFLDPIAEIETYKYIFDLAGDRLVFFISHRLGFAKYADRIVVVKDGCIVEDGTHSDLLSCESGIYKEMFESQLEWYK